MHADFALWLERWPGSRDEHAAQLAHHYAEAARPDDVDLAWSGDPARYEEVRASAVRSLRSAAELAASRYEIDEALALLERALELEPVVSVRIELLRAAARTHVLRYDVNRFRARDGGGTRAGARSCRRGRDLQPTRIPRPRPAVHVERAAPSSGRRAVALQSARAVGTRQSCASVGSPDRGPLGSDEA
jgi:hypothetical protein